MYFITIIIIQLHDLSTKRIHIVIGNQEISMFMLHALTPFFN